MPRPIKIATAKTDAALADEARALLSQLEAEMNVFAHERQTEIGAMLDCAVAGEHMLMIGDPGIAKSMLADMFADAFEETPFSAQLTKTMVPKDLFGEFDIQAYEKGEQRHMIEGMLPTAKVAILDELYKANPALLNSLLRIILERKHLNGSTVVDCPLRFMLATSNGLPEAGDPILEAFADRILVKFLVERIQNQEAVDGLLWGPEPSRPWTKITFEHLDALQRVAKKIGASAEVRAAMLAIRATLHDKGIKVSDRRWKKAAGYLRAHVARRGGSEVTLADLEPLENILWNRPEDRPAVRAAVREHLATWRDDARQIRAQLEEQRTRVRGAKKIREIGAIQDSLDSEISPALDGLRTVSADAAEEAELLGAILSDIEIEISNRFRSKKKATRF